MSTKVKVVISIVVVATAFAAGRFLTPVKVKTEIKTVEVVKVVKDKTTDLSKKRKKKTTITETTYPDGRKETKTEITDDTDTEKKTDQKETAEKDKTTETNKEVVRTASRLNISALGGGSFAAGVISPVFGASVTKDIIGPISIGAFGLTNGTIGGSLGLSF